MIIWLKGLLAAAIGGAVGMLVGMVIDPDHFNLQQLRHLEIVAGIGAFNGVVAYLAKSPIPQD